METGSGLVGNRYFQGDLCPAACLCRALVEIQMMTKSCINQGELDLELTTGRIKVSKRQVARMNHKELTPFNSDN